MMEFSSLATAVGFMAGLGLLLAAILVLANKRLFVFEDPRIDEVEELLPSANCGSCGSAGCCPAGLFAPPRSVPPVFCHSERSDEGSLSQKPHAFPPKPAPKRYGVVLAFR